MAASSPFLITSSSTCISFSLHCIVEIIMTNAFSTSHFLARKNRRRSASGWSCFTILQKVLRSSSAGMFAIAALNSAVWPNLSSSADIDNLLMSDVGIDVPDAGADLSSVPFSPLFLLKTFNRLFFLSFFPSAAAVSLVGVDATDSAPFASSDPVSAPKTFITIAHSSRSFLSSSGVRVPGRPAGVFGAMMRKESVRSATSNWVEVGFSAVSGLGEVFAKGIRSAPPMPIPITTATVQMFVPLLL